MLVVLIYNVLKEQKWIFIASELVILFSLYLSYLLYQALIKPIDLMQSGTDAISDKDFSVKYLKTGSKEVDKLVNVFNSMIDNLREERTSMSEQSYFIQKLMEVIPLATVILDIDGNIANVNPAAVRMLGIKDDYVGQPLHKYDSELIRAINTTAHQEPKMISINGVDKYKCQTTDVIHQGFKRRFILIDDLSTEILQSEKDAFGRIIRMMAHEVNNSMGAVNSIIDTVIEYGFEDGRDPELKSSLEIAMERNKGLAKFMDNYATILRLPTPNKQPIDLCKLLQKCGQLYTPIATSRDISIENKLPPEPITIVADSIMLQQAISNILKNAVESIEEDGDILITCVQNPPGFIIADNGAGISEELEHKLFTPFFSTKPTGQGVGLMLIRDILQSHDAGFILKTNRDTGWTEFQVSFS